MMKSQDVLVWLKLAGMDGNEWTYQQLAAELGLSRSETHASVKRSVAAGLLRANAADRRSAPPRARSASSRAVRAESPPTVVAPALVEFLVHGIRYVWPAEFTRATRGLATAASSPVFETRMVPPATPIVWPHAQGTVRGEGIVPFHRRVPDAARRDAKLNDLLAVTELLRCGNARERGVAAEVLRELLGGD